MIAFRTSLLVISLSIISACAIGDPASSATATGYTYVARFRTPDGKYYDGFRRHADDTPVYIYDIPPTWLDAIDRDRMKAAHTFIVRRNAVPPECGSGFRVVRLGRLENGAVVATIECNQKTAS